MCGKLPPSQILHIEHEHVRGWKRMPPEQRKMYVRGLACYACNSVLLRKGNTPEKLRNAAKYLEAYERKKTIGS